MNTSHRPSIAKRFMAAVKSRYFRLREKLSPSRIRNAGDIPVIINNFNRLTTLRSLITSLEERGLHNIHILDNNSTYPPLLEWYRTCPYEVIHLGRNLGFKALWKDKATRRRFCRDYYAYTDSDVVLDDDCPADVMEHLFRLLKDRGVDVKINGSVTRTNRSDMEKIYAIGRELEAPVHMDTYMLPGLHERRRPFEEQARLMPEEAAAAELETIRAEMDPELFPVYVKQKLEQTEQPVTGYPSGITCMAGNCSFAVNWQGEMRPCVTLKEPTVSVFKTGFEAAWREISEKAKKFRINDKCTECPLRPICKTCAASAWLETGDYDGLPEYLCRYAGEYKKLLLKEMEKTTEM